MELAIIDILLILFFPTALSAAFDIRGVGPNSKAGLAWPNGPWADIRQYTTTGKVSWYYTWSPNFVDTTLEYVPMLWGERQVQQWTDTINQTISAQKVTHALAFNEPEQSAQSNLTAQRGVELWRTYVQPLKSQGVLLGSPAPSSAPSGKTWLQDFLELCGGNCTVDFIALHWYGINSTQFIEYMQDFHTTFQRPVWITEWACENYVNASEQCSQQDVINFMNATQSFMDETDWVERYAWFGAMKNMQGVNEYDRIMDIEGRINDLGRQYIGAISSNTTHNYTPGVVNGGSGGHPGESSDGDETLRSLVASGILGPLAMALFVVLLV